MFFSVICSFLVLLGCFASNLAVLQITGVFALTILHASILVNGIFCYCCEDYFYEIRPVKNSIVNGLCLGVQFSWWVAFPLGIAYGVVSTCKLSPIIIPTELIIKLHVAFCILFYMWVLFSRLMDVRNLSDCLSINGELYALAFYGSFIMYAIVIWYRFGGNISTWLESLFY